MSDLINIDILGGDYEFTLEVSGIRDEFQFNYIPSNLPDIYKKILNHQPFVVSEFSLSNYTMMLDRNIADMYAIPVFVNRGFRHSIIWVRKDSKIDSIEQLKSLKVGIKDYSQTAAVWLRGILYEEYKIHWSDIDWYANTDQRFDAPKEANLTLVDDDPEKMVINGELDVYIAPKPMDMQKTPDQRELKPLITNFIEVERDYFKKTGIYPINHCVMIQKDTYKKHPNIAYPLFLAYSESKKKSLKRKLGSTLLPWSDKLWANTMEVFNNDPHPHGLAEANHKNVSKLVDYLFEQKLIKQKPNIEELFIEGSQNWRES